MSADVDEPVVVREYDPSWPERYEAERLRLTGSMPSGAVAIEHVGSTAVPGLAAKPIIDVLVGVVAPCCTREVASRVVLLGYQPLGEAGVPGRLYFRRRSAAGGFNVHLVDRGAGLWRDNLLLRDYLRTHPADAEEYAAVKRRAADSAPDSLLRYSELKAEAVRSLLERARATLRD